MKASEHFGAVAEAIIRRADDFLKLETDPYPLVSENNGVGTSGRALQKYLGLTAFAGYLTGKEEYFDKGVEIILAATRDTEPSETWPGHLQRADAAQAFAIGYDWLYPFLTPDERTLVRNEIRRLGHILYTEDTAWGKPDPAVTSCNHNPVHFGALGLCALVLGDQPEWLDRSIDRVRGYFRESTDGTGYTTEGLSYFNYGLLGALPFSYALERTSGLDLAGEQEKYRLSMDQFLHKWLPSNAGFIAMNDNVSHLGASGLMTYFIFRYKIRDAWWLWLEYHGEDGNASYGTGLRNYLGDGISAPFVMIWGDPSLETVSPAETGRPLSAFFESGRVFARTGWEDPQAAFFAMTSGYDFHKGHNHQDENAVFLHAYGDPVLIDPGYWFKDTRSHTTMIIGGAEQILSSSGRIVHYRDTGKGVFAYGQAPEAYDWTVALVGYYFRKAYFARDPFPFLVWRDDAQVEQDRVVEFVENFAIPRDAEVSLLKNKFRITMASGKTADVHVFSSGGNKVTLEAVDLTSNLMVRARKTLPREEGMRIVEARTEALNPGFIVVVVPNGQKESISQVSLGEEGGYPFVKIDWNDPDVPNTIILAEEMGLSLSEGGIAPHAGP